jgi:hypothetical protein
MIIFDNAHWLDSAPLAAILTTWQWSDRPLGLTRWLQLPHRQIWLCTGNNLGATDELLRRSVWIRLDTGSAHPEQRSNFRHENLLEWAEENRGKIISAILTILRAWCVAGRPQAPTPVLASFDPWARTLGAVLDFAELRGFLGNRKRFGTRMQSERPQWDSFLIAWAHRFGDTPQTTAALVEELFHEHSALRAALPVDLLDLLDSPKSGATKRLAHALRQRIDVRHGDSGLYIEQGPPDRHTKVVRWQLGGVAAWGDAPVPMPAAPDASSKAPVDAPPPRPPSVPPPTPPTEPSTTTTEHPGARRDSGDGTSSAEGAPHTESEPPQPSGPQAQATAPPAPPAPRPWLVDATPYATGLPLDLNAIGVRLGLDFGAFPILQAVGPLGWYDRKTSSVAASILAQLNPEDHSAFQVFLTRLRQAFQEWSLPRVP